MRTLIKLYEAIISQKLAGDIEKQKETLQIHTEPLEAVSSGQLLSAYFEKVMNYGLRHYKKNDDDNLEHQITVTNALIDALIIYTQDPSLSDYKVEEKDILRGITGPMMNHKQFFDKIPLTSVAKSNLFTGNQHEPVVYSELKREIATAEEVNLLVSFIKFSGLRLIFDALKEHTLTKPLRIITTSYMGATDLKAVEMLAKLPHTEVKISYDTNRTRLHAKAYYFARNTGYSTAYIGSSNLSKAALSEGTEWNLKISEYDSPDIIKKYKMTFESYWNMDEFERFESNNEKHVIKLKKALDKEGQYDNHQENAYYFDLTPYAYQQAILDQLVIERQVFDSYRNLIVAATGTGKTMVSAFDFKRYAQENPRVRLLFLAHREEILKQSLHAYRAVLRDHNYGELWVGGQEPSNYQAVFASIQTLNHSHKYEQFDPDYFDYIVLDETHHGAAHSYQRIIQYFKPQILLGLTATPERMDGKSILDDFNHRMAYEIRLKEAIDSHLLCPFHYFGVSDEVDLSHVKWQNGRYDVEELTTLYMDNHLRDRGIIEAIDRYTTDWHDIKGIGFCVSQKHAHHMAETFCKKGIASIALDAHSTDEERFSAKKRLSNGEITFIFVVDLYNEGVDIPEINTILFLRPTESATVFVQQLGRGLRLHPEKEVLTVLDFVGQARKEYNFQMKFQSLMGRTSHGVKKEIEYDFPSLPRNCSIQLERVAKETILENIDAMTVNARRLKQYIKDYPLVSTAPLTLENFIRHYQLTLGQLYKSTTFTELRLGVDDDIEEGHNFEADRKGTYWGQKMASRFLKLAKMTDITLIKCLIEGLEDLKAADQNQDKVRANDYERDTIDRRRWLMLYYTLFQKAPEKEVRLVFKDMVKEAPCLFDEIIEILKCDLEAANHLPQTIQISQKTQLELHADYSIDQILAAFGYFTEDKKPAFREGTKYIESEKADLFFITLNKSEKLFSESTRYEDYAINEWLFHWQSQSRTTRQSPTGQRYIKGESRVYLFVREEKKDSYGAAETFTFLGQARPQSSEGEAPISMIYKLDKKMPLEVLKKSNQVVDVV